MAILIKTDGTTKNVLPTNGTFFTAKELHDFVGGFFEFINPGNKIMVVNEDGWNLKLPVNNIASMITTMAKNLCSEIIVGDVVVCDMEEIQ